MPRFKRGVTLVELLIVVAIVSILAAAVMVAINPGKRMGQARDSTRKAALSVVSRALLAYYLDHQTYPNPGPDFFSESTEGDWMSELKPDYLKNIPKDPKQAAATSYFANKGRVAGASTDRGTQEWRGFYVHPNDVSTYQANTPLLTGTIIEQKWSNLETSPGVFFSGQINQLKNGVTNAANAGAKVGIRIWAGHYIPSWLCDGTTLRVDKRPQCVTIPDPAATVAVPWDPNYQERYKILVDEVMYELSKLPQTVKDKIYWVNVGAGVQFNEMSIKDATKDVLCDPPVNYTATKYKDAWVQATNTWVSARGIYLPGVPVLVHLDSAPRDATTAANCKLSNNLDVANMVADAVCPNAATCSNIWFGTASMSNGKLQGFIDFFIGLLGRTKVGFQIREELITDASGGLLGGGLAEYEGAIRRGLEIRKTPTDTTTGPEYISIRSDEVSIAELKAITEKYQPCFVNKTPPSADPTNPCATSTTPACSDGLDNDGDGKIDLADPGCADANDEDESDGSGSQPVCSDGIDNDSDGKIDLSDPGCIDANDSDETDQPSTSSEFKYRYYSADLQTFQLWAVLEDKDDKEAYDPSNPAKVRTCKKNPPSPPPPVANYNYCVAY